LSKFERLLLELNLIKANPGINVSRLAKETGVSERTIYRDIFSLSSSLIPVYYDNGYRILDTAFLPTLNFTADEYKLLSLRLDCCAFKRDDLQKKAKSLLTKIDAVVDPKMRIFTNSLSGSCIIHCRKSYQQKHISTFAQVLDKAIQNNYKIKLFCESMKDGTTERIIHPYSLVFRNHSWYLLGFSELDNDFGLFNLNQLKRITLLDVSFKRDLNFSVEKFFENKWEISRGKLYNVQLRFKGESANQILSFQHQPKEKVTKQKDGSVIYYITVEGLEEIARWILSFGKEAEVLKPKELRERIFRMGKDITVLYASKVSFTPTKERHSI